MNNQEMIVKIHLSMNQQCKERGYAMHFVVVRNKEQVHATNAATEQYAIEERCKS